MNWNIQLVGILINLFVASAEDCITAKQIDRHSLNRADINKCVSLLRIQQIRGRQNLWIKFLIRIEVFALEALTVNFVDLIELQTRFRLERGKSPYGLCGQRSTVNKEQNSLAHA